MSEDNYEPAKMLKRREAEHVRTSYGQPVGEHLDPSRQGALQPCGSAVRCLIMRLSMTQLV
jgi:hypothetical protein